MESIQVLYGVCRCQILRTQRTPETQHSPAWMPKAAANFASLSTFKLQSGLKEYEMKYEVRSTELLIRDLY